MLWNDLLHNSTLRWGGSIERMSKIIDVSKEFWKLNARLESLPATIKKELGDQARFSKNYKKAESLYKESLKLGDHPWARFELGNIQMNNGDYINGCDNIFKALDMRPTLWLINKNAKMCKSKGHSRN
jgi:tetratricopeptide (TPR) repeat protein